MLKAIIVDDEENSRNVLIGFLKDYCPQIKIMAAAGSVVTAFKAINALDPDVVFMDIELKGETSFELIQKLGEIRFEIIFVTAYHNYMLRAIRLSAIDYLLKPINVEELKTAIEKVEQKANRKTINTSLDVLLNNLKNKYQDYQISIPTMTGFDRIKISNIIYLESQGAYTHFVLKQNQKITTSKNIREYEDLLLVQNFFRIHRSNIVSIAEITKYINGEGGQVMMSNNVALDVSRRRKEELLKMLDKR